MALIPPTIDKGATLAAVSPAGPVDPEEFGRGCEALAGAGFKIERLENTLRHGEYLAGTDEQRAHDLMLAFEDDRFEAVLCTRGGYGSVRLLPLLDYSRIALHPKPLIGFSDVSALQLALWQRCSLVSFSGPQLAKGWGGGLSAFSQSCWLEMLGGRSWGKPLPVPDRSAPPRFFRDGHARGTLLGGNLAILASLVGTPYAPRLEGAIVVLEEIDEPPYRIDRMIAQLRLAGAFEGVQGFVLGRFLQHVKGEQRRWDTLAAELLTAAVSDAPVLTGVPYGHLGDCWTLPIGADAVIDGESGSLTVEKPR